MLRLELPDVVAPATPNYLEQQYEQLGVLLVRRSHLLLGLWDGVPDRTGRAGTAAVLRMRLEGDHGAAAFHASPMFLGANSYLDVTNRGPVLHIPRPAPIHPLARQTAPRGSCALVSVKEPDPATLTEPARGPGMGPRASRAERAARRFRGNGD